MKFKRWNKIPGLLFGIALVTALLAVPVSADSERVTPEAGYAAHDYTIKTLYHEDQAANGLYEWYSGGLDVGYADVAEYFDGANPNNDGLLARVYVHQNSFYQEEPYEQWMETNMYTQTGEYVTTLVDDGGGWPQCVKIIGNEVWFSFTGGSGAGFYSVPWSPDDLSVYPATPQLEVPDIDYNWEVEVSALDGEIFFAGLAGDEWEPPADVDHAIWHIDQVTNAVTLILDVGGYSSGFAIDSAGNLWSGEYLLGWDPTMHIEACRLGMWTKAQVDAVIAGGTYLQWSDATVVIDLGTRAGTTYNWGPNDIEADSGGNVYVSLNTYSSWGENYEYGAVIQVYPHEGSYATKYITDTDSTGNDNWDWHRGMAFDGEADIDTGGYTDPTQFPSITGNRLYLDMDHNQNDPNSPDQVVGITVAADYDNDGVPDSLDNAPETANAGQEDTDGDMYGNAVDADFNNNGSVNIADKAILGQAFTTYNPDCDFDSNGSINILDKAKFGVRFNTSEPWY